MNSPSPPRDPRIENASSEPDAPELDPKVQEAIGHMFQNFCETMVKQPIPDKFVVLLAKLEAKERDRK
jgi:hypothetical protein